MIIFIINELSTEDPLIELRVLKNFEFTISQIVQCLLFSVLMAVMYIMPLFLQNIEKLYTNRNRCDFITICYGISTCNAH